MESKLKKLEKANNSHMFLLFSDFCPQECELASVQVAIALDASSRHHGTLGL